jgi:hypothetical protein
MASEGDPDYFDARDPKLDLRPPGTRKKTRHWCRGKRGVPHKLVVRDYLTVKRLSYPNGYGKDGKILLCSACGKEFDTYVPRAATRYFAARQIPDWVTNPPPEE